MSSREHLIIYENIFGYLPGVGGGGKKEGGCYWHSVSRNQAGCSVSYNLQETPTTGNYMAPNVSDRAKVEEPRVSLYILQIYAYIICLTYFYLFMYKTTIPYLTFILYHSIYIYHIIYSYTII